MADDHSGSGSPDLPSNATASPATASPATSIHATCILVGEWGVLIRGRSGAGKSSLARSLIERAAARGLFARLVADDRVHLASCNGRLIARPAPRIAGRIEWHGIGIRDMSHERAAIIRCIVDLVDRPTRLPEPHERRAIIAGIDVPRFALSRDGDIAGLVLDALAEFPASVAGQRARGNRDTTRQP